MRNQTESLEDSVNQLKRMLRELKSKESGIRGSISKLENSTEGKLIKLKNESRFSKANLNQTEKKLNNLQQVYNQQRHEINSFHSRMMDLVTRAFRNDPYNNLRCEMIGVIERLRSSCISTSFVGDNLLVGSDGEIQEIIPSLTSY